MTQDRLSGVQVASGHSLSADLRNSIPDAEIREYVLLREPEGQFLSLYNLRWTRHEEDGARRPPPFEIWYRRQRRNPITRFLCNRYFGVSIPRLYTLSSSSRFKLLEDRLREFYFVGAHDRVDEMIAGISEQLGIATKAERFGRSRDSTGMQRGLSKEMIATIRRENALDTALFERWKDRGWVKDASPTGPAPAFPRHDYANLLVQDIAAGILKAR